MRSPVRSNVEIKQDLRSRLYSLLSFSARINNAPSSSTAPYTLILHENGAFRKRSSNRRKLKTLAVHFNLDGAFRNQWRCNNRVIFLPEFCHNVLPTCVMPVFALCPLASCLRVISLPEFCHCVLPTCIALYASLRYASLHYASLHDTSLRYASLRYACVWFPCPSSATVASVTALLRFSLPYKN